MTALLLQRSPLARFLGVEVHDGVNRVYSLPDRDELVGNFLLPALHGGAIAAFIELCCAAELAAIAGISIPPRPISINLQYLSGAKRAVTFSTPVVRRVGRRIAVVHGEAWQDHPGKIVCAAQCEFKIGS
ncbi:PaaI family thioesterase [Sphingopyxis sp.]|uniref:PaaI family thioesterase n=1 Tax=Sphingopyxis sp. TaxID=1908224 RepID=UPI0035B40D8B